MASTWGNSWGGETGSWLTSWSGVFVPPQPPAASGLKPAGRSKKGRKRTKVVVEIDGELHAVSSAEEAHELLESVRDKQQEVAIKAVAKAAAKPEVEYVPPKPPKVEIRGEGPDKQQIQAQVDAFNANLRAIQAGAMARYAAAMAELDDEDAIVALIA